ncbi:Hypothetical_protein [Hexamita inflata]|uniref:Hypothetical_protein n=1 Tax=Hexamita inflata TaxID=28002 RepID=A0ABP1LJP3_9EUKA
MYLLIKIIIELYYFNIVLLQQQQYSTRSSLQRYCVREIHEHANNIPARANNIPTYLPDSFLSKHCCLAVARANEEVKLHYTSLITNALHEGTITTKQGQRDRQATGRRAPRAPPGLEGVGARQEGEAQGNAGSDGLGVTVEN